VKAPRVRIRSLLIVIALAALIMAGVVTALRRPGRPYSNVFAGFDPVALLGSQPGYRVQGVSGWNVFNTSRGYAFKEWRGIITTPNDPSVRQTIQDSIERYIAEECQGRCHTQGSLAGMPHELPQVVGMPTHAVFVFNEGDRHGDLHVWLFPDSSGSTVGYAIFLREEPFDPG
jgi:hypothetical protein